MGNLTEHARRELEAAGAFDEDTMYGGMLGDAVMELVEKFSSQGHSGGSAPLVVGLFQKVALYKPLCPITGEDSEWSNSFGNDETYQNKRLSSLFKQGEDGRAYYLNAIVFNGEDPGDTFTGTVGGVRSRQYVKEFPFTPKTFYIDVRREEYDENNPDHKGSADVVSCGSGDYVYFIKDPKQLDEVFMYYDKFNTNEKSN